MATTHFIKLAKPKKSVVYDDYWKFAVKRYDVFLKRLTDQHGPWTEDEVIKNHRFTNVFRASDRVSQFLIKLQYKDKIDDLQEIFFKTMLFKIFNKIETYRYLENELGEISHKSFNLERYDELLAKRMSNNTAIYSAAYIMPSAGSVFGHKSKHTNHLALLSKMMADNLPEMISQCNKLENIYKLLLSYPSFGTFLAFQYSIDINYSSITDFSEMDFVVAGPGAKSGILKCFDSIGDYSFEDVIKYMADNQENEFKRLGLNIPSLWGRQLQLIDCQNLFCEVDKYLRVTNPEVGNGLGRKRIKQKFLTAKGPISFFFPPKWGINDKI